MQRTISGSFRLRLVALVMLGILPPLWGAIWYASHRATNMLKLEAQTGMAIRAEALGEQVDQWHQRNSLVLDKLRSEAEFDSMERSQQLPSLLSTLQSNKTEVDAVVTLDLEGEVVADAATKPIARQNYRHQSWFRSAAAGLEHSRVVRSQSKSDPTVIFSKPILAQPKLSVGDRSDKVAQLQRRLRRLNYYTGPIDGIYAGETVEAIARFKQAYLQEEDSGEQVDPMTWQSIDVAGDATGNIAKLEPKEDRVEGVVMIETQLSDIKQAVENARSGRAGYVFVLDENGHVLLHSADKSEAERSITKLSDSDKDTQLASSKAIHRSFLQASKQSSQKDAQSRDLRSSPTQNSAAVLPAVNPLSPQYLSNWLTLLSEDSSISEQNILSFLDDSGEHWIAHSTSLASGWQVVLAQPNHSFSKEAILFRHFSVATGAIALLATAVAVSVLSARLTQPILSLSNAADAISLGHLDQKVTVESRDEIGKLASAFNSVAQQLQQSFAQLAEQNEALKRSDKLKDQFLANTSHELKTPLNGVIGIAESLLEGAAGPLNEAQQHNISMIAASSHRLTRLVNDILDFSKLQHQQLSLHCKPIGVFASVNVVLALSQTLVGRKSLKLENKVSIDCPLVWADENRVQQILLNLVSNAIKFTHAGTVSISAELIKEDLVAVSVYDTGIGILEENLTHIFQPFEQVEQAARSYGGTGLGLSIVQQLVALHGGELWVNSSLGEGSVFTFTLPVAPPSTEQIRNGDHTDNSLTNSLAALPGSQQEYLPTTTSSTQLTAPLMQKVSAELSQLRSLRKRKQLSTTLSNPPTMSSTSSATNKPSAHKFNLLVVDDEPINVQVLRNHLSLANYTVTHALNGKEALALLNRQQKDAQRFDLVVLDVMMPRMSGYEVCQKLREIYPAHELPVVMLTAKNQVSDLLTGFHFGANDYMTKPFSKDELLTRIKSHLRLSKTNHAYGRFVPSEYLRFLEKESIVDVRLGDHVSKEMAVMFSDIRSFTSLSERMTPQENFDFVNAYLRQVSPVIRAHTGFIVKYLGDGMMAVFPQGVDDAIAAGIAKQCSVAEYNQRRQSRGFRPIAVGIGIHFGHMMVGMVGESARMQGDAFSDNVNLTARLESLTKHYGVAMVISGQAHELLTHAEQYHIRFLDRVIVKGRCEPIDIYQVVDGEPESVMRQIEQTRECFEAGIASYQSGDFIQAKRCFDVILQQVPTDKTARLYCDRLSSLIQSPPEYWNGVWTLAQK